MQRRKSYQKKTSQTGVLFRAKRCFGIMNLYPYTPGHFMVIPYVHTDNIESLDEQTWMEMSAYVREGVKILKRELNAAGVNIGMNLGKAGGAGIAEHVHYHLVPRWSGDTNFYHLHRRGARKRRSIYSALREAKSRVC